MGASTFLVSEEKSLGKVCKYVGAIGVMVSMLAPGCWPYMQATGGSSPSHSTNSNGNRNGVQRQFGSCLKWRS